MGRRRRRSTKYEILQCATKLFLEKGYTMAYVTTIANALEISTGNLTFHFPTKEHILAELVKVLCEIQNRVDTSAEPGEHTLLSEYLHELAMIASVCEDNPNIKDLIMAVYSHPLSLEVIRKNDTKRSMQVYKEYCPEWTEADYAQMENIVSGMEYAMFMTENTEEISFEQRVSGGMDAIMKLYDIPKETRQRVISDVMASDYRNRGTRVFEDFYSFVQEKIARAKQR